MTTKKSGFAITDRKEFVSEVDKQKLAKQIESVVNLQESAKKKGIDPYWLNPKPLATDAPPPSFPPSSFPHGYEIMEFEGTLPELINFLMNNLNKLPPTPPPPEKK